MMGIVVVECIRHSLVFGKLHSMDIQQRRLQMQARSPVESFVTHGIATIFGSAIMGGAGLGLICAIICLFANFRVRPSSTGNDVTIVEMSNPTSEVAIGCWHCKKAFMVPSHATVGVCPFCHSQNSIQLAAIPLNQPAGPEGTTLHHHRPSAPVDEHQLEGESEPEGQPTLNVPIVDQPGIVPSASNELLLAGVREGKAEDH